MSYFAPVRSQTTVYPLSLDAFQSWINGPVFLQRAQIKALPRLVCSDGFSLSVQASTIHRCTPQSVVGPYSHVECAYPSSLVPELLPFICEEEGISSLESSYNFVPAELVIQIINDHGGLLQ